MAGGNLSPRQKMINMMYLVLTALLALNISKDILDSLTKLNQSLDDSAQTINQKNQKIYANFARAAQENEAKAGKWNKMALDVKKQSDDLNVYLADLKHELIMVSGGYKDDAKKGSDLAAALDQKSKPANYLLNEKNATKLKVKIEAFRSSMAKIAADNANLVSTIESTFNTDDTKSEDGLAPIDWEHSTFDHFPLGAILPFLTDYQAKIRNVETDVLTQLEKNIDIGVVKFNKVEAVVVANSNYVTQGGEYRAEVFLAAYDSLQVPTITIEDQELAPESIVNGRGIVTFKATNAGPQEWGGVIKIKQLGEDNPIEYTIPQQTFTVAPPSVVISPTKMNVFYRGVKNPVEIAVPGADPNKIRVSGGGVAGSPGNYFASVDNIKGKTVTVSVGVEETQEDGSTKIVPYGSKEFRIKGLPQAEGNVYQKTDAILSPNAVKGIKVEAVFRDFAFELPLTVTGFEITIPGFPPEKVRGNKLNSGIKSKIGRLKPGSTLTIRKIQAKAPGGIKIRRVSNITIDIN